MGSVFIAHFLKNKHNNIIMHLTLKKKIIKYSKNILAKTID